MRIRVEGPRSAKPSLVFIHGAGGSATVWLDLFRHFERTRHVVAPDLPSHGQSDAWPAVSDGDRVRQYADAVGAACAHLQIGRAVLVGHSMGGIIALSAAAAYPDKVAAVCLLNAAPGLRASPETLEVLAARRDHQAEFVSEMAWSPATSRDVVDRWARTVMSADADTVLADFRAVNAAPAVQIACKAMLVGGQDDLLCSPAFVKKRAEQMGAEHRNVADAGHFVHLEKPADAIAALEELLTFV